LKAQAGKAHDGTNDDPDDGVKALGNYSGLQAYSGADEHDKKLAKAGHQIHLK